MLCLSTKRAPKKSVCVSSPKSPSLQVCWSKAASCFLLRDSYLCFFYKKKPKQKLTIKSPCRVKVLRVCPSVWLVQEGLTAATATDWQSVSAASLSVEPSIVGHTSVNLLREGLQSSRSELRMNQTLTSSQKKKQEKKPHEVQSFTPPNFSSWTSSDYIYLDWL